MKTIMRTTMPNEAPAEPRACQNTKKTGSAGASLSRRTGFASPHAVGATLSEVLVSLLVMSIGVVSLATLFPISVLRSLQATQLTSAANLRYNVEAFLGVNPQFYTIGTGWQRATSYVVGDLVTPTGCCSPSIVLVCTMPGTSGSVEPTWNTADGSFTSDPVPGGPLQWQTYRLQNYVVDPLGKHLVETNYRQTTNGDYFGFDAAANAPRQVLRSFPGVLRYGQNLASLQNLGLAANQDMAADFATLPDSWISQVEVPLLHPVATTVTSTSCILTDVPYDLIPTTPTTPAGYLPSRIVLFDITGKISHVRPISNIGTWTAPTQTITWPSATVASGPLPSGFVPVRARVETKERRYTWMLSVRRDGDSFQMEIVVFFRRPFSGKDEQVYPATFTSVVDLGYDEKYGVANYDDDYDSPSVTDEIDELGFVGSDDTPRNWVVVQYDGTGAKPFVKKGGYVTDADNLRWYRILDVFESDTPANVMTKAGLNRTGTIYPPDQSFFGANTASILLRVENKIVDSGPQPPKNASGVPTGPPTGKAMLMRNIIDVYPIRTRVINESQ